MFLRSLLMRQLLPMLCFADEHESWVSTLPEEMRGQIPEEYQKDESLTKFKTIPDMVKSFKEMETLVGKKGVIMPTDKSTPEEINKFYNTLGRPESPDKYEIKLPENLNKKLSIDEEGKKSYLSMAHKLGLTNKQANELLAFHLTSLSDGMTRADKAYEEKMNELKTQLNGKWGDKTQEKIALAQDMTKKILGEEKAKSLGEFGNNPAAIELIAELAGMVSEDNISRFTGGGNETGSAKAEIDKIFALSAEERAKHPYFDDNHPKHKEAVEDVRKLYEKLYAEGGK